MKFTTYIVIKDEEGTESRRESRKKTLLIGILLFLIGIVFLVLEYSAIAFAFVTIGSITYSIGQAVLAYTKDKVVKPSSLLITDTEIIMFNRTFLIDELNDLSFNLCDYDGIPSWNRSKVPEGNDNEISFLINGKLIKTNFHIPTIRHYIDLIDFLEEKKIKHKALKGFPWT